MALSVAAVILAVCCTVRASAETLLPPYIHQCNQQDPQLSDCYVKAILHIRPWLATGIPEVNVPSTEPFRLEELSLSLTQGPGGYRISLKDVDVRGVSNFTVRDFTLGDAGAFSLGVAIPELLLVADYSSSGVLIMIPASGRGTLYGSLRGVRTQLRGSAAVRGDGKGEGGRHVHVDRLLVDLKVSDVNMRIERPPGGNYIIAQATNMFLRTGAKLVLDAMMPELRLKLADVFLGIANNIFAKVPVEQFLTN